MFNIAFIGSHRVGKTTLAERIYQTLKVDYPDIVLISRLHENQITEFDRAEDVDVWAAKSYLEAFEKANWHFVADRSAIDPVGYALANDNFKVYEQVVWLALQAASRIRFLIYVPITFHAAKDFKYQKLVDKKILEFLEYHKIPYYTVKCLSVDDRIEEVLNYVDSQV